MAKIVFVSYANLTFNSVLQQDGFLQGFSDALTRAGNELTCVVANLIKGDDVVALLIKEKPDLIVSFNHVGITQKVLDKTNCPVVVFFSDNLPFVQNLSLINANPDRYYLLHHADETVIQAKDYLKNIPEHRQMIFGYASSLRKRDDIEQDIPISFIGSLGNWDKAATVYFQVMSQRSLVTHENCNELKRRYLEKLYAFLDNPLVLQDAANLPCWEEITHRPFQATLTLTATCHKRYEILSQLTDLGLTVFSWAKGMADVLTYNEKMFECFDFTPSTTLEDSERNYNRSKISLNMPHGHALTGFSWRVCDILASNACLLSDPRKELTKLMGPYIDMPTYESPAEARELAQKLLKDDAWRKDIVAASQRAVDENCRFEQKLKKLEDFVGIPLINPSVKGTQKLVVSQKPEKTKATVRVNRPAKRSFKEKLAYKIWKHLNKKLIKEGII